MSFSVNSKALFGLPPALDRRSQDLAFAGRYFGANTVIGTFGLADIDNTRQRVAAAIGAYLRSLRSTFADPDAERIRAAIASYRASDLRAARRADAAVPVPAGRPPAIAAADRGRACV